MTKEPFLIISFSTLVDDARVLKQVAEFAPKYHLVTCGYGPAPSGAAEHIQLDDAWLPWHFDRKLLVTRSYHEAYWRNAAVAGATKLLTGHISLTSRPFLVILANDYETVPLALSLKPRRGVLADLHEYAPSQKENLARWRLFVKPFREWVCRTYLPRCAAVTTVGELIASRYSVEFGINPIVVRNATPKAELVPTPVRHPIRLVHHGVPHAHRNLEVMLDAVQKAKADITMDLFLMETERAYLRALRDRYANEPRIRFHPPIPYPQLVTTLNRFDVGVFNLPPVTFNYRMALPNKFFDFVQARLGAIVGPSPEMATLVRRYRLGAVSKDFTAASLTSILDRLTLSDVNLWKHNADAAAHVLHAEREVAKWDHLVTEMVS